MVLESQGTFMFPKSQGTFVEMLVIVKLKNVVIFIGKKLVLSFHTPGKTSCNILKIVRKTCVQVKEKVRESQ